MCYKREQALTGGMNLLSKFKHRPIFVEGGRNGWQNFKESELTEAP
jgi:hypothetical protein